MKSCGNCTMCCLLLHIPDTNSKPAELCKYCEENVGCKIYENRPEPCRIFECAWKQMKQAHIDLRPDNCKVLFEKWTDNLIVGSTIENTISPLVLRQIDYFRSEGISVLMIDHKNKVRTFYLAKGHTKDYVRNEINGSTKLHRRLN